MVHANGAAFDNPDLLVCCVGGDGVDFFGAGNLDEAGD
jgi:phosphoketolase